jgi:hypothetical protein
LIISSRVSAQEENSDVPSVESSENYVETESTQPDFEVQIEKTQNYQPEESGEELENINLLPAEREKYNLKNIITPVDKAVYREKEIESKDITGKIKFDLADENNQHIEYAEMKLSKEITPYLYLNSNLYGRNVFSNKNISKINSETFLFTDILPHHRIYLGQARLSQSDEHSLSFMQKAEDAYGGLNAGIKLDGDYRYFDYSMGSYNGLNNQTTSSGATVALKNLSVIPALKVGGGAYSSQKTELTSDTYGIFSEYGISRFSLKGELARNVEQQQVQDDFSKNFNDSWALSNKIQLTNNLSFIAKHNQKVEQLWRQNDVGLQYSMPETKYFDLSNLKLELNASYTEDSINKQNIKRFGMFTKYNF